MGWSIRCLLHTHEDLHWNGLKSRANTGITAVVSPGLLANYSIQICQLFIQWELVSKKKKNNNITSDYDRHLISASGLHTHVHIHMFREQKRRSRSEICGQYGDQAMFCYIKLYKFMALRWCLALTDSILHFPFSVQTQRLRSSESCLCMPTPLRFHHKSLQAE